MKKFVDVFSFKFMENDTNEGSSSEIVLLDLMHVCPLRKLQEQRVQMLIIVSPVKVQAHRYGYITIIMCTFILTLLRFRFYMINLEYMSFILQIGRN
jgi:hypothetical protein